MNFIRVAVFVLGLVNTVLGIYNHNIFAAIGWGVASLYMGKVMMGGFLEE